MKNNYFSKIMRTIMMTLILNFALSAYAQNSPWEKVYDLRATNAFHITNSGNLLLADYLFEMNGGIYVSTDKGQIRHGRKLLYKITSTTTLLRMINMSLLLVALLISHVLLMAD